VDDHIGKHDVGVADEDDVVGVDSDGWKLEVPEDGAGKMLDVAGDVAKDEVNLSDEDEVVGVDNGASHLPAAEDDVDGVMDNMDHPQDAQPQSKESSQSSG
jgi:hypothetical protein